ncbi:unnamed protein product [Symbiodinium sp. CCMP2592]|nr:unnamed protein product [Symbiodinium sp. CCMP2592]
MSMARPSIRMGYEGGVLLTHMSQNKQAPKWSFAGKSPGSGIRPKTPGPGTYGHQTSQSCRIRQPCHGFGSAARDKAGMALASPGPGAYGASESYGSKRPRSAGPVFGRAARGLGSGRDTPGPGSYVPNVNSTRPQFPRHTCTPRRDGADWGHRKCSTTPGPGTYGHGGAAGAGSESPVSKSAPRWAFGTADRGVRANGENPGPGQYDLRSRVAGPKFSIRCRNESARSGRLWWDVHPVRLLRRLAESGDLADQHRFAPKFAIGFRVKSDVGLSCFLTPGRKLVGKLLSNRITSDFQRHDVLPSGEVLHLGSLGCPPEQVRAAEPEADRRIQRRHSSETKRRTHDKAWAAVLYSEATEAPASPRRRLALALGLEFICEVVRRRTSTGTFQEMSAEAELISARQPYFVHLDLKTFSEQEQVRAALLHVPETVAVALVFDSTVATSDGEVLFKGTDVAFRKVTSEQIKKAMESRMAEDDQKIYEVPVSLLKDGLSSLFIQVEPTQELDVRTLFAAEGFIHGEVVEAIEVGSSSSSSCPRTEGSDRPSHRA